MDEIIDTSGYGYENMSGMYTEAGGYTYWTKEWNIITGNVVRELDEKYPDMPQGTVANLDGNILEGKDQYDEDAFFVYQGRGWATMAK